MQDDIFLIDPSDLNASDLMRLWVRSITQDEGLSLGAVAEASGIAPSTMTRFVNGPSVNPLRGSTLLKIIAAFPNSVVLDADALPENWRRLRLRMAVAAGVELAEIRISTNYPVRAMYEFDHTGDEFTIEAWEQVSYLVRKRLDTLIRVAGYSISPKPYTPDEIPDNLETKSRSHHIEAEGIRTGRPRISSPELATFKKDLPILGGAQGGVGQMVVSQNPIELTFRPPQLDGVKDAFAVYVSGESMVPKYEPGALLWINPVKPPRMGDYVLIELGDPNNGDHEGIVKRYWGVRDGKLKVEQYNAEPKEYVIDMKEVISIKLVVGSLEA